MPTLLDLDQITTGRDGRLFVTVAPARTATGTVAAPVSMFLAQVNAWSATVDIKDTDYQAAYDMGIGKVATGVQFMLTITEAVIKDDPFLTALITALRQPTSGAIRPYVPYFDFTGIMDSADDGGQKGEYRMSKCKPTGSFDFFKITPGAPNERTWNFVSRVVPAVTKALQSSAP